MFAKAKCRHSQQFCTDLALGPKLCTSLAQPQHESHWSLNLNNDSSYLVCRKLDGSYPGQILGSVHSYSICLGFEKLPDSESMQANRSQHAGLIGLALNGPCLGVGFLLSHIKRCSQKWEGCLWKKAALTLQEQHSELWASAESGSSTRSYVAVLKQLNPAR